MSKLPVSNVSVLSKKRFASSKIMCASSLASAILPPPISLISISSKSTRASSSSCMPPLAPKKSVYPLPLIVTVPLKLNVFVRVISADRTIIVSSIVSALDGNEVMPEDINNVCSWPTTEPKPTSCTSSAKCTSVLSTNVPPFIFTVPETG